MKYKNFTKEELIQELERLNLKKKYGLVWEENRNPEGVVENLDNEISFLELVQSNTVINSLEKPNNIMIEGDNYHALSALNYTHRNKVDVIYIDPPYNTGARDWLYNNDFVDKEDRYKHSKYTSFMSNRLKLAAPLLKEDGIIIVAIDDYEVHTIRMLLDDIFKEDNRLGSITVVHNPRGRNDDKFFATSHEYMLVYAKNSMEAQVKDFNLTPEDKEKYSLKDEYSYYETTGFVRTGNNSDRNTRPNLFYPIYYDESLDQLSLKSGSGKHKLVPIDSNGNEKTWRWSKETFEKDHSTELLVKKIGDQFKIFKKRRLKDQGKRPKTIWWDPKYDASSNGIMVLRDILGPKNEFPYPKSIFLLKDILEITTKKDSVILDFFAGSGTTAQAAMMLNQADGGSRSSILCTDRGHKEDTNIAQDICYPRIKKIISGYKKYRSKEFVVGSNENLIYLKINPFPFEETDRNKYLFSQKAIDLICLKENTFKKVNNRDFTLYKNDKKYTSILYEFSQISKLLKYIENNEGQFNIYIFSFSNENYSEEFFNVQDRVNLNYFPEPIFNNYKDIFKNL